MTAPAELPVLSKPPAWLAATCKTGFAASRRKMMIHRVDSMQCAVISGRVVYWAHWVCGGSALNAVIIADPEPLGGICRRCETAGWTVYHCYSAKGLLLYIGSTGNWSMRRINHERNTPWWPEVAEISRSKYPNEPTARAVEVMAIRSEGPLHNKEHARRQETA